MTIEEFLTDEKCTDVIKLRKKGGHKHYLLWWDSDDNYFLNYQFTKSNVPDVKKSALITRRDSDAWVGRLVKEGYEIIK